MTDAVINIVFALAFLAVVGGIIKISIDEKKARNAQLEAASALIKMRHAQADANAAELRKRHAAIARQASAREATSNARESMKDPSALAAAVAKARAENPQRMQRPAPTKSRPSTHSSPARAQQPSTGSPFSGITRDTDTKGYGQWENGVWVPIAFAMGGVVSEPTPAPEPQVEEARSTPEHSTPDYSSNDSSSSSDSGWSSSDTSGGGDY